MKGKKTARVATIDALPAHLRAQARAAFAAIPAPQTPQPFGVSEVALRQPEEQAKNARLTRLVDNLVGSGDKSRRSKFGAVPTVVDGIRFDSKREARYYEELKLRVLNGEVRYFLRQVPLHLPGGTKLVVDFLEVLCDGRLRYVDVKGHETAVFKVKRREVEAAYPVRIELE